MDLGRLFIDNRSPFHSLFQQVATRQSNGIGKIHTGYVTFCCIRVHMAMGLGLIVYAEYDGAQGKIAGCEATS